jgi:hypothetical protein
MQSRASASSTPGRFALPRHFWWGLGILLLVMAGSVLPLCGGMFRCGCTLLHGDKYCNIHEPHVPHCPWCAAHWSVMAGVFAAVLVAGAAGVYGGLRIARGDGWQRLLTGVGLGVAGYLATASLAGLIMAVVMRYPMWWGIRVYG